MDHIQKLLSQTGWSCEDLISKLTEFKQMNELQLKASAETQSKDDAEGERDEANCDIKKLTNGDIGEGGTSKGKPEIEIACRDDKKPLGKKTIPPGKASNELSDHTYTLTVRLRKKTDSDPLSPRNRHLRFISICRRSNFLFRARRIRRRCVQQRRINRKVLIARYRTPAVVRSQIMEQLQLLRSRRSALAVGVKKKIPGDRIVSKKRYVGEKCSDIVNELMEFAEDQSVEIESSDILMNNYDIIIGNDLEVFESTMELHASTSSKPNESITETIKNRIGAYDVETSATDIATLPGTSFANNSTVNKDILQSNIITETETNEILAHSNDCSSDISVGTSEEDTAGGNVKNIMIVDVRGGCEVIPNRHHTIKPTKTKDITKIKGWKNKKFDVTGGAQHTAFASSNLDGFLEVADLQISFKIPTLDSGAATTTEVLKIPTPQVSPKENDVDPFNLYRPRTLGQKKRIMKLKYDVKSKRNVQKPRTLAEKRRLLGHDLEKIKIVSTGMKDTGSYNYSHVLHRGKRLRVITRSRNSDVIAYIKSTNIKPNFIYVPKKPRPVKDKPSIFKNTLSPTAPALRYRPGPLCRKANLQYDNQNWKTILKKLPKVTLTIVPEYKKPIDPRIIGLLPQYGFDILPDRLQFALTALKPQKKEITCFEFNVPYQNNQQEIVLCKKVLDTEPSKTEIKPDEVSIEETCRDIIDKMLIYLDIKEISDDVIKNDVNNIFLTEDKVIEDRKKEKRRGFVLKKRPKQLNKTNYELKRLNVKVIEVNLEEKEEIKNCKKDFCRLGCICRSLSTTSSLVSNHCGRPECMFECLCNYERKSKGNVKVTLPIGTDLLSEGAVNRLEDEAKRNLAKVEKEFTQTVIQANNQTIVVGGCTNRQRRVTKLPKKYTDYVENLEYIPVNLLRQNEDSVVEKYKGDTKTWQIINCTINLTRLELNDVIPFCLVHSLYDCHCGYEAEYIPKEPIYLEEPNEVELSNENRSDADISDTNKSDTSDDNETPAEEHLTEMLRLLEQDEATTTREIKKGKAKASLFPEMDCARTKGIPTDYYRVRNRTNRFITMRNRKFVRNMNKGGFSHDMQVDFEQKPVNSSTGNTVTETADDTITVTHEKSRRKQELVARIDGDMYIVDTPEKKTLLKKVDKPPRKQIKKLVDKTTDKLINQLERLSTKLENIPTVKTVDKPIDKSPELKLIKKDNNLPMQKFKKIFPLAQENVHYFQPSPDIASQFVSMLGKKTNTIFCLLQWQTLATNYRLGKINVWFSSYFSFPQIVITDLSIVPKYFTNVKNFESDTNKSLQRNEIVKALITDGIPGTNPKDEVQVILELTPILCHVHGTIKKNQQKQENLLVAQNKTSKVIQAQSLFEKNESNEKGKRVPLPYPTVRKIMFSKIRCLEYNYVTVDKDNENILPHSVSARLPTIKSTALWRMIKLNSDFSVLSLEKSEYRIKYSDLQKVLKMADERDMTIAIRTEQDSGARSHKDFGIYASPKCQNAVFVGPYYKIENHDITLMRYLNRELVPTKLFNKMKGLPPANIGVWIEQSKDASTAEKSLHTIDLTESDQEEMANNSDEGKLLIAPADLEKYEDESVNYYATQNYYVELDVSKKLPPLQGYVYFSTNVTSLGYILGHQLDGDAVLVRYPTFNTVLRFKNHAHAVTYLEKEFVSSFIEAPGFSIKIIINNKEDTSGIVFNPEFLKGYYIVSESGLTNVLELTSSKLRNMCMSEFELHRAVKSRASRIVYDQCLETARTCLNMLTFKQRASTKSLIDALRAEAEVLTFDQKRHKLERTVALQQKPILLEHFKEIFVQLAPHVNVRLKNKMQEVLKRHGKLVDTTEPPKVSPEVICVDAEKPVNSATDVNLPIYTKNPDMIITATNSSRENGSDRMPKIIIKDLSDLREKPTENKSESVTKDKKEPTSETTNSKPPDKQNIYKYLWKTAQGKIIEIGPEQYEMLRAQKMKPPQPTSPMKAFQIGPVTITPKLSKVELDPIMARLPTAELKRITIPDNLPPGFVKLTLKNTLPKLNTAIETKTTDVHR